MVLKEEQAVRKAAKEKIEGDFRRAVEGGDYLQFDRHAEHDVDLGALESTKPENIHDRDDIYLSSSDDDVDIEDDVEDKRSLPDAGEQLVFGSDDEGDLDEEDAEAFESDEDDDVDSIKTEKKTLLVDLDPADEETKQKRKISAWCNSSEIKDLLNVEDLDAEGDSDTDTFSKKAKKPELVKTPAKEKKVTFADLDVPTSEPSITPTAASSDGKEKKKAEKKQKKLRRPLTAEEKALAVRLVQSAKSRRDLLEWNFHRYRFFEDPSSLPDWFVGDEKKHMRKPLPLAQDEKKSERPVTGKTLKKAEEAKARKKMRLAKRLKKVRKRAENLPDDLTERETWSKIKTMYKNAGLLKKKRRPVHRIVNTKAGSRETWVDRAQNRPVWRMGLRTGGAIYEAKRIADNKMLGSHECIAFLMPAVNRLEHAHAANAHPTRESVLWDTFRPNVLILARRKPRDDDRPLHQC
nr:unnamed protein product [Spirometra erinaceieuropaei]